MKTKVLYFFIVSLFLGSCKNDDHQKSKDLTILPDITKPKDESMKTKEFSGDFDSIEVSQAIEAEVVKSDYEKVVISAPSYIIDEIVVSNTNGSLKIQYKSGVRVANINKVRAKIYARDFVKVAASSGAEIKIHDQFTQDKTDVVVSSAGEINGDLEANDMKITASSGGSFSGKIWAVNLIVDSSSSGSVDINGKTKTFAGTASSGADIDASQVSTENAKVSASSGADIEISVISYLEAVASSGASVDVLKSGSVTIGKKEESSGGSVSIR